MIRGQLASVTDAAGVVSRRFRYNDDGLMVWHQLPGGLESEYRWQKLDHWRVVENRTNSGDGCHMHYDLEAGITRVSTYDGQQREHHWNAAGLITCFIDERGEKWRYEWDENELLTRRINPLGNAVSFTYDDSATVLKRRMLTVVCRRCNGCHTVRCPRLLPEQTVPQRNTITIPITALNALLMRSGKARSISGMSSDWLSKRLTQQVIATAVSLMMPARLSVKPTVQG